MSNNKKSTMISKRDEYVIDNVKYIINKSFGNQDIRNIICSIIIGRIKNENVLLDRKE